MAPLMRSAQHAYGQNHDRILDEEALDSVPSEVVEINAWQKMLSATSGSLLTGLLVTPLDVVRVRWQSQGVSQPPSIDFKKLAITTPNGFQPQNLGVTACCREVFFMNNTSEICLAGPNIGNGVAGPGNGTAAAAECAVEQTQQRTFNSTLDGLRKIARNEGVTTLWRGLSPTLIMAIPANIIYFTGYEWLRFNPKSPIQRLGIRDEYAPLVGGAVARTLAATAVSPIELFRTRLQALSSSSSKTAASQKSSPLLDTFRGIKDMVHLHGYRALWRGLTLTLWRDVPFSGMYWLGYETIRGKLTDARERMRGRSEGRDFEPERDSRSRARARRRSQSRNNHTETFTDSFVAGALSGAIASVATSPFDVGKTRTQVYREAPSSVAAKGPTPQQFAGSGVVPEESNMTRLLWHIFKTEGLPGLFKGWIPRTLKVAPACAIMISSYEVGKRVFRGANERAAMREKQRTLAELEA
ncbi:mitochondrial carrier protein MTM1 [Echria macrotheca]|uniref:Mitochondrial carrier protein MTM1 n=1 Tax=Echria macrotheca TaxID=438768 RepID=A0AAJ0FBD1_9PEZI|nr:mitochondrial carrier protein MTM1 [Echria macrotheca]